LIIWIEPRMMKESISIPSFEKGKIYA